MVSGNWLPGDGDTGAPVELAGLIAESLSGEPPDAAAAPVGHTRTHFCVHIIEQTWHLNFHTQHDQQIRYEVAYN